jgi:hypothetical protein
MKIAVWHNLRSGGGKRALYDHVVGLLRLRQITIEIIDILSTFGDRSTTQSTFVTG